MQARTFVHGIRIQRLYFFVFCLHFYLVCARGGHRHLQIGRMLDIDLISEPPTPPPPQMYVYKVWESVWPEAQEAIHS
jgi:hypothetical protein